MLDTNSEFDIILTAEDVQKIFRCGINKAHALMKLDDFPSFIINNRYYVERTNLMKWIQRQNKRKKIMLF